MRKLAKNSKIINNQIS